MVIKAVFFDIGGTLVTSTSVLKKHIIEIDKKRLKLLGHNFTEEELKKAQKETDKLILKKYGNPHKEGVIYAKEMYKLLGVELDDETAKALDEQFWIEIHNKVKCIKNSKEILAYLKDNDYKLIAVTNNFRKRAICVLEDFGFLDFFDDIITSEEFGLKSTTTPFKVAMDRLNLKSDEVLMVGNNIFEDVLGAKKAGIKTILVIFKDNIDEFYKNYAEVNENIKADYVINDLIDIKNIIEKLNGG